METPGPGVNLRSRKEIRRDVERYIVLAGDLMDTATNRNWKGLQGYQLGGKWFDLTEVPCLWKFQGFVTRGRITPLIKTAVMAYQAEEIVKKKAEEVAEVRNETGEMTEMPNVYRNAWPYDSLQSIAGSVYGGQGFVEIPVLEGISWEEQVAQKYQKFFFQDWDAILANTAQLPFKLDDFAAHIERRMKSSSDDIIMAIGDAYLESVDKTKIYMGEVVNLAKNANSRGMNDKGYLAPISGLAKHYAAQLGISIEKDAQQTVVVQGSGTQTGNDELELRKIAAQEEANRLKAIELGLDVKQPIEAKAPPVITTEEDGESPIGYIGKNDTKTPKGGVRVADSPYMPGDKVTVPGAEPGSDRLKGVVRRKLFNRPVVELEDGTKQTLHPDFLRYDREDEQ